MRQTTHPPGTPLAKLMILLSLVLIGRTLWAIGRPEAHYHPYTIVSVMLELFCLGMCAAVYIVVSRNYSHRSFQTLFLCMLAMTVAGMLGDICTWGVGLENFSWFPAVHAVGSFLRDAMGFPLLVVYSIYLLSYVKEDAEELTGYGWLISGLCADGFFLVIINQITSRSETEPWYLWNMPWLFFFFLAVPMAVNIGTIYSFRTMLTNRKAITFIFYELLVLATVALDIILVKATFAYSVTVFSMIQIYVSVQIEYEKQQEERLIQQQVAIMLSQIQPHFLYNVLTSIRALCRIDPRQAETALVDFTKYLRANLDSLKDQQCIPFSRELEHTHHYTDLEKMRYGQDLTVVYTTPVIQFSLPVLTLEPIVENAVRHGVMQREQGGTVTITTSEDAHHYLITVTDDGVGFDTTRIGQMGSSHVGLVNVRQRLESMCGGELEIRSAPGEGTVAVISIPKRKNQTQGGTGK